MTNELNEFGVSHLRVFHIGFVIQLESNSQRVSVVGAQPDLRVGEGAPIVEAFCWLNVHASWWNEIPISLSLSQPPINTPMLVGRIYPHASTCHFLLTSKPVAEHLGQSCLIPILRFCWWTAPKITYESQGLQVKSPFMLLKSPFFGSVCLISLGEIPRSVDCTEIGAVLNRSQEKPVSTMLYFGWAGPMSRGRVVEKSMVLVTF